jgi:hypothetical protein
MPLLFNQLFDAMNLIQRPNKSGDKIYFYFDLGRAKGQRHATGVFIYVKPKDQIQKTIKKEATTLPEVKSQNLSWQNNRLAAGIFQPTRSNLISWIITMNS